ncbi:MAG: UDP-N-acetylmuramoyl-tripeptide--D-alanyl-D-alanine ligase [Patescibacteria group bacterium]
MKEMVSPLVQNWVGPHLPQEHIFVPPEKKPTNANDVARLYFRKWLIHPLKRHLTHSYSEALAAIGCEIIGITGSAGKTTVKELIASVLSQKFNTVYTPANIDPIYNIPTTVLKTPLNTQKLILEMGIEYPGEMDFYLWLAKPKTGVVTTIYYTHTQFLGSLDNVKREKGKLIESLPKNGYAILNYDDRNVRDLAKVTDAEVVWYGTDSKADIRATDIEFTDDLKTKFILKLGSEAEEITLNLFGQQFVPLALAAAAVGHLDGIEIKKIKHGLEKVGRQPHRMIPIKLENGTTIIDDSYNANPLATKEALRVLGNIGKGRRKIFIFAEMKELGQYEEKSHREVGAFAAETGVNITFGLGELTRFTLKEIDKRRRGSKTIFSESKKELIELVKKTVRPGDVILVKGSRSMAMEEVVDCLAK